VDTSNAQQSKLDYYLGTPEYRLKVYQREKGKWGSKDLGSLNGLADTIPLGSGPREVK